MARRAAKYRLVCGSVTREVSQGEYANALTRCYADQVPGTPRTAKVRGRYKLWIDHQTGTSRIELAEAPIRDPHAIRSIFYLMLRMAIYNNAYRPGTW